MFIRRPIYTHQSRNINHMIEEESWSNSDIRRCSHQFRGRASSQPAVNMYILTVNISRIPEHPGLVRDLFSHALR